MRLARIDIAMSATIADLVSKDYFYIFIVESKNSNLLGISLLLFTRVTSHESSSPVLRRTIALHGDPSRSPNIREPVREFK